MKKHTIIASVLLVLFYSTILFSQTIPHTINYQGVLKDPSGVVVTNGDYNLTFKLYDVETDGSALWTETKSITITDGIFNTQLGSSSEMNLAFDKEYWLGISVGSDGELTPRIKLSSVPYSFMTMNVMDGSITAEKLSDNSVTTSKIVDGTITENDIGDNQLVKKVNGIRDSVNIIAGSNISISPSGNTITISSSGGTGGGDITSVNAGSGLTGGGTTGDVTLSIANNGITTQMLSDNSVTSSKINDGSILGQDIQDNSITNSKIVDNTITKEKISGGNVVKSLNALRDDINLVAGSNINIIPSGSNLTISSTAGGTIGGSGTANYIPRFTGNTTLGNSILYQSSNNLGIGTLTPGYPLHVLSNRKISGYFSSDSLSMDTKVLTAEFTGSGTANPTAVYGKSLPSSGYGIGGSFVGGYIGVNGSVTQLSAGEKYGVFGSVMNGSGLNIGVSGAAYGTESTNYGVYGYSGNDGYAVYGYGNGTGYAFYGQAPMYGIRGSAYNTTGTAEGVHGISASSTGIGVFGEATNTTGINYGGRFTTSSTSGRGVYGSNTSTTGINYGGYFITSSTSGRGVEGYASANSGTTYGVYGLNASPSGIGVLGIAPTYGIEGRATNTTGIADGIRGLSNSTGGTGVFGAVTTSSGINYGGYFQSSSPTGIGVYGINTTTSGSGSSYGVYGKSVTTGMGRGVFGISNTYRGVEGNTQSGVGVYGVAEATSGINYGIVGRTSSSSGWAGYFFGNVGITGVLTKGAGSFKIDHPLDPQNKYLYHSFVESPDMKNIYDGNVITDASGYAIVILPEWFEALNKDFRYQLTVIGDFAQAIISKEIQNNQFEIRTDKPNIKISWQVTGIRKDAFAEKNRIPVEENKQGDEVGKYLYPEAYGLSKSMGISNGLIESIDEPKLNPRMDIVSPNNEIIEEDNLNTEQDVNQRTLIHTLPNSIKESENESK